jgi:two-component system sensor histidine kinase KdpD
MSDRQGGHLVWNLLNPPPGVRTEGVEAGLDARKACIEERSVVGNYVSTAEVRLTTQTGPNRRLNATVGGGFRNLVKVTSMVAAVTAAGQAAEAYLHPHGLVMLYLLVVVVAAACWGRWPAVVASGMGVVGLNFFFVPPRYTLRVHQPEYFLTFGVMLGVGLLISELTARRQAQFELARRSQAEMAAAYAFSRALAQAGDLGAIEEALNHHLHQLLQPPAHLLVGTRVPEDCALAVPLASSRGPLGWVCLQEKPSSPDSLHAVESAAAQAAMAVERVQLGEEARHAQLVAEAERLQTTMFNAVSHDLQTPISSIQGALDNLCDPELDLDHETIQGLVQLAREQTRRLSRLVGNLLDMSRVEAGVTPLRLEPVEIADLLGSALQAWGDERQFDITLEPDLPMVRGDLVLLVQVLVNLLENAAKYGAAGNSVELQASRANGGVELRVVDHGPGIPPDQRRRAFEKFYRLRRPGDPPGTGLGLAICQGFVLAHGGSILAEETPGGGTTMVIWLPSEEEA